MPTLDRSDLRTSDSRNDNRNDDGERANLTVAQVIKQYTPDFIAQYGYSVASQVTSTLARIGFCRTAPMGGRTYACKSCKTKVSIYNSCGDRHCPQCSGARRSDWLQKSAELLLPGVTYFQVVFTLPDKLSSLILGNRPVLYRTLMHAAWESLQHMLETQLGMRAAALMVLHTWNQRLEHHPHVHLLVPGSGPSLDGQRWIQCRTTKATGSKPAKPFLVDNEELGQEFQRRFLRKLNSLRRRGKLELGGNQSHLQDDAAWNTFTESLKVHDWCVFIERPPTRESSPEHVLKYLARYMTGGPISDRRLVSSEAGRVTFLARSQDKTKPTHQVEEQLAGTEFVRRWSLHILPRGFTKSRGFGGYSSGNRKSFIALCTILNPSPPATPDEPTNSAEPSDQTAQSPKCPKCQQPMELTDSTHRPSWRDLFYGPDHPAWFET